MVTNAKGGENALRSCLRAACIKESPPETMTSCDREWRDQLPRGIRQHFEHRRSIHTSGRIEVAALYTIHRSLHVDTTPALIPPGEGPSKHTLSTQHRKYMGEQTRQSTQRHTSRKSTPKTADKRRSTASTRSSASRRIHTNTLQAQSGLQAEALMAVGHTTHEALERPALSHSVMLTSSVQA